MSIPRITADPKRWRATALRNALRPPARVVPRFASWRCASPLALCESNDQRRSIYSRTCPETGCCFCTCPPCGPVTGQPSFALAVVSLAFKASRFTHTATRGRNAPRLAGYPERFAQEALGHNSKAIHRAYAKRALTKIPSLEDYEQRVA